MPRPKLHANHAARQAAYRARQSQPRAQEASPEVPNTRIGLPHLSEAVPSAALLDAVDVLLEAATRNSWLHPLPANGKVLPNANAYQLLLLADVLRRIPCPR